MIIIWTYDDSVLPRRMMSLSYSWLTHSALNCGGAVDAKFRIFFLDLYFHSISIKHYFILWKISSGQSAFGKSSPDVLQMTTRYFDDQDASGY